MLGVVFFVLAVLAAVSMVINIVSGTVLLAVIFGALLVKSVAGGVLDVRKDRSGSTRG